MTAMKDQKAILARFPVRIINLRLYRFCSTRKYNPQTKNMILIQLQFSCKYNLSST